MLLVCAGSFGKQSPGGEGVDPFANKMAVALYPEAPLGGPVTEANVLQYLGKMLPYAALEGVALRPTAHKTSPGGEHFTFEQYYKGLPVFNSQVKINIGHNGTVYSIFDNSYNTAQWPGSLAADAQAMNSLELASLLATFTGYAKADILEQTVIAVIGLKPGAYKMLQLYHPESGDHRLYLLDATGTIAYNYDLNAYSGVPASAYVFNPDPITSAETIYLAPYVDSSDANTAVLRNERVLVQVDAKLTSGVYYLENDYFVMSDFSIPNQIVVSSATPSFLFTRADSQFEEVNAYYHLNVYRNYVASLGYTALVDDQIQVDAHALNGSDNSQFSFGGGFPRLLFGDGGIDDAEDADVIVHEYGHALSYAGSPGTNFGQERTALDEGFGDYFATSYSRSLSTYRWADMFTWDGHNEYWTGRTAATTKIYPADLGSSIHRNGEMWATALMEVWTALGQEKADKLALETLFGLSSNMSMSDAALVYIQADNALYGGDHYNIIHPIMVNRGFLNGIGIAAVAKTEAPAFELHNSHGFNYHNEPAVLYNYTGECMTITVFDISGKAINQLDNLYSNTYSLSGNQLLPGTYIIKVEAGSQAQTFKLVK